MNKTIIGKLILHCFIGLWLLSTSKQVWGVNAAYTFEADDVAGPYHDTLTDDGAQDGLLAEKWRRLGEPVWNNKSAIFGSKSLHTTAYAPIALLPAIDLGGEVTIAAHVRSAAKGIHMLFGNYDGRAGNGRMYLAFDPGSEYGGENRLMRFHYWRWSQGSLSQIVVDVPPIADWSEDQSPHHIALTYNNGTAKLYFDGRGVGQGNTNIPELKHLDLSGAENLFYGGLMDSMSMDQTVDDILVLDRVLSSQQIKTLYEKGITGMGLAEMFKDTQMKTLPGVEQDVCTRILTPKETREYLEKRKVDEDEWTFEAARKVWKPMTRNVQHVGVPGYDWQTGVLWDGSLFFGPFWRHEKEVAPLGNNMLHLSVGYGEKMRFLDRLGQAKPNIRRWLEQGRLPIPHVESNDGDLVWRQTTFAHLLGRDLSEDMRPQSDDVLITHACWKVRNTGFIPHQGHLWLHFSDASDMLYGYKCNVKEELGKPLPHKLEGSLGLMEGAIRYVVPEPVQGQLNQHKLIPEIIGAKGAAENVLHWQVSLEPGEEAEFRILIPYGLLAPDKAKELLDIDSNVQLASVRVFWEDIVCRTGKIITPDPFINDYLAAVVGQMAQQVAYRHYPGIWMYKTSPNNYENYWPCNAAQALPAFDFRGLTSINRKVLQSFIDMQTDDVGGLARTNMGHGPDIGGEGYAKIQGFLGNFRDWTANPLLISHGLGMWALAQHYRITRDDMWLHEGSPSPLQAMLDAFDWVVVQRKRTMHDENGEKVPQWGMLPAASAHDWLAGNAIHNDAFCIFGMAEVVRLLRETGHPRTEEMSHQLNDYQRDLQEQYAKACARSRPIPLGDGCGLPYVPRVVQELDWSGVDWTYTCFGPLRAAAMGALPPDGELADMSLAFLEAGMPSGKGFYFSYRTEADHNFADVNGENGQRHFMWRHYVDYETMWPMGHLFLARDDLPRFFEFLFNNLAMVLHHDFRVGVESLDGVPSNAPGDGDRWQLIRAMFINDEFDGWDGSEKDLFLLQAIPRYWLRPGNVMLVENMPTRFGGEVKQLKVEVADDGKSVTVDIDFNLKVSPKNIRIRLRSGDGSPLAAATLNGKSIAIHHDDIIVLPNSLEGHWSIVGSF